MEPGCSNREILAPEADRMRYAMIKRLILSVVLIAVISVPMGCVGGLADGNLIGVVVREGSGETIPHPSLIVGRTLKSPTVPDQQIVGDAEGRFEITAPGGNYTVQISSNVAGPYYTWPGSLYIAENKTSVVLLQLPEGY
jgi:hypothetical protein